MANANPVHGTDKPEEQQPEQPKAEKKAKAKVEPKPLAPGETPKKGVPYVSVTGSICVDH